jgi:Bacterial Ig-like domain (group 3)/FG-GAP-like repeat
MLRTRAKVFLCGLVLAMLFALPSFAKDALFAKPARSYPSGGAYTDAIVLADVNGDKKPDVIVANRGDLYCGIGSVSVMLGNGDGTLQPARSYDSGGCGATSVAVTDVNGDGKPDVLVANLFCSSDPCGGSVGVLLGNGDGTFQDVRTYSAGGDYSQSIAVGDINGDGKLDLIVNNGFSGGDFGPSVVGVLMGNGDGTFQAVQTYMTGAFEESSEANTLALEDVNNDGKLDILVALNCVNGCFPTGYAGVLLGNGDGTFQAVQIYPTGTGFPSSIVVGDVNGDGVLDLAVNQGVLLGNGDGTFQTGIRVSDAGFWTVLGDVNRDGNLDELSIDYCLQPGCPWGTAFVIFGNGDGSFQQPLRYKSGGWGAAAIAVGDLNGDQKPDLVIANLCARHNHCDIGSVGVLINSSHFQTATSLNSNLNPSLQGQAVTLTATVTSSGWIAPTGTVKIRNGATVLGTPKLIGGVATLIRKNLPVGTLSITATYNGDSQSATSTSPVLIQVVNSTAGQPNRQ